MPRTMPALNMSARARKILQELCSIPTAPFVEQRVVEYVRAFVAIRPKLRLSQDRFGNLLIELPQKASGKAGRWVFTAHMDHPGFIARRMKTPTTLEADFRGGVDKAYFTGTEVRLFDGDREIAATVIRCTLGKDGRPSAASLRVSEPVTPGSPGMWDVPVARFKGGRFHGRVCDDLAGAAAALAMLDVLHRRPPEISVAVLLTRAEEEGFIGAIAASRFPALLRKTDRLIAIECSSEQPYAPQGGGVILRVGDRTSIFHSGLTYFMAQVAANLAKKNKTFRHQRALMPGGTCEATVYDIYGFAAASLCIPLGNYHNMNKIERKIAPETINLVDWHSMVKLFIAIARHGHEYQPGHAHLKMRLQSRFDRLKHLF